MRAVTLPAELLRTISRDEVVALPIARYAGEVVVVASPAELERAAADFAEESVVGIDTETRPAAGRLRGHRCLGVPRALPALQRARNALKLQHPVAPGALAGLRPREEIRGGLDARAAGIERQDVAHGGCLDGGKARTLAHC